MNENIKKLLSFAVTGIKIIFLGPLAFSLTVAGAVYLFQTFSVTAKLIMASVFPAPYILKELCTGIAISCLALVFIRLLFNVRLKAIPPLKTFGIAMAFIVAAGGFTAMDEEMVWDFKDYRYPEYILSWPLQTVTQTFDCDYLTDTVYLSGSFSFVQTDFRADENVEIVHNAGLTDSYQIEIQYRGKESEMYIFHDDYMRKDYGLYQDNISIWPVDYDYELSSDDIVYMYVHGHDLRYSEPLVIEKIIVRTAYPDKIDISNIVS